MYVLLLSIVVSRHYSFTKKGKNGQKSEAYNEFYLYTQSHTHTHTHVESENSLRLLIHCPSDYVYVCVCFSAFKKSALILFILISFLSALFFLGSNSKNWEQKNEERRERFSQKLKMKWISLCVLQMSICIVALLRLSPNEPRCSAFCYYSLNMQSSIWQTGWYVMHT